MSLRNVQRQAASRYAELGTDLSSSLRPRSLRHRTSDLPTTARLLRNSRLFALPSPIPRPMHSADGGVRNTNSSESATSPFPSRAAIVTPSSSFAQGDWGLKRPLPGKAFRTTTPVIRVNANDTIDHITDFESAADHVFTLQKFQEMDLPISKPSARDELYKTDTSSQRSAFDDAQDPKDIPAEFKVSESSERGWGVGTSASVEKTAPRRWKYTAPWVAGMHAGEFDEYVKTQIKKRRVEFREWLRARLAERPIAGADASSSTTKQSGAFNLDEGLDTGAEDNVNKAADSIIEDLTTEVPAKEDTVASDMLRLRSRQQDLYEYVWDFLDLPGKLPSSRDTLESYATNLLDVNQGPPTTHPSAGVSYLRPAPWLHNHPINGPSARAPPVPARVLQRTEGGRNQRSPMLGVGGIVVGGKGDAIGGLSRDGRSQTIWHTKALSKPGGPKTWVVPQHAYIDSRGRIKMDVQNTQPDDVEAWRLLRQAASGNGDASASSSSNDGPADQQQSSFGGAGFSNLNFGGASSNASRSYASEGSATRDGGNGGGGLAARLRGQNVPDMRQVGRPEIKRRPDTTGLSEEQVRALQNLGGKKQE